MHPIFPYPTPCPPDRISHLTALGPEDTAVGLP